jgi:hypothetical protein
MAQIRSGLAANLATITGMRVAEVIPDNPQPPVAVFELDRIEYDQAMQNGLTIYRFTVQVIVGRASVRSAQRWLDALIPPTGDSSVKAAIESNRTMSGVVQDVRVESMPSIGSIAMNDQTYLAAQFDVVIYA